ncbi:MAG: DUF3108 domain-containing protein [Gemmatimonadaceae bacterium]|nr:DUF3108 domain-containing protein [Gemmatimonadaceae bacterium]
MPRAIHRLLAGALLLLGASSPAAARQSTDAPPIAAASPRLPSEAATVPFHVGEKLEYDVKFGSIKVGSGSMEVRDFADVRGTTTWHTVFLISGGIPFYRVNDRYESWFDVVTLSTRRYHQDIDEGSYEPKRHYEFFTERGMYQENDKPELPTVALPLDDGSFLYFVRTIPLEVGKEYSLSRYFKPDANPVVIKVLRRETVKVPAGTFNTVVLQPTFKSKGLFGEGGKAEVWVTDDDRRMMVQMKSRLSVGSINLSLRNHNTKAPK